MQEAIAVVFRKFVEYGSARQVLLWLRQNGIHLPAVSIAEGRELILASARLSDHHQVP